MLQLEELLRTIDLLKEANVVIPNDIHEKVQKYEIQMLQDELGFLFNKFLFQKLQTYIKHEYSIVIEYAPEKGISINVMPKSSGKTSVLNIAPIENIDDSTIEATSEVDFVEERILEQSETNGRRPIIKTDIKNLDNVQETRNSLKMTFPNGDILYYKNIKKFLVELARYIGVEKLYENDKDLVVTSIHYFRINDSKIVANYENITPDYWIYTNYTLRDLLKLLSELNRKMRLGAFIEIVDYNEEYLQLKNEQKSNSTSKDFSNTLKVDESVLASTDSSLAHSDASKMIEDNCVKNTEKVNLKEDKKTELEEYNDKKYPVFEKQAEVIVVSETESSLANNTYLATFLKQLSQMKVEVSEGFKSPHKAVLILAIIKGIQSRKIKYDKIYLDNYLISLYLNVWTEFVPSGSPFVVGISNAFIHLSLEPFFHIRKKEGFKSAKIHNSNLVWTITSINNVVQYAYIDEQLDELFNDKECCNKITRYLVNEFRLKNNDIEEEQQKEEDVASCNSKVLTPIIKEQNISHNSCQTSNQSDVDKVEAMQSPQRVVLPKILDNELSRRKLRIKKRTYSFLLYGDTSGYEEFLKEQCGSFNEHLPEGKGWVFPKKKELEIKEFLFALKANTIVDEPSLKSFLDELSKMKTSTYKGVKSPHKAIYILAIIQGIKSGQIKHDRIYLDENLINLFNKTWLKYVPTSCPFAMSIINPFIHLSSSPFYHLHTKDHSNVNLSLTWTINSIHKNCDYAYVDDSFYKVISNDVFCDIIIESLINNFGLEKKTDEQVEEILKANNTRSNNDEQEKDVMDIQETIRTKVPSLKDIKFTNKYKAAKFRLTYPNGYIEESNIYPDVFVEFVKYAGPKRVRELNIYSLGTNLVAFKEEINSKYATGYKDLGGGLYLNTISTTQRKYETMKFLSEHFDLNVKIELLPSKH